MTEERTAHRIRQSLNQSLANISPTAQRRLEAARHHALLHQKAGALELAYANGGASNSFFDALQHNHRLRQGLAILALLSGMAIASYWHAHQYIVDLEDVDSALLTDSIPPEAFLDKGFAAWLDDSSEE